MLLDLKHCGFFCDTVSGKCDHSKLLEMTGLEVLWYFSVTLCQVSVTTLNCWRLLEVLWIFFCDTVSGKCDHSELLEMLLDLKHCGIFL